LVCDTRLEDDDDVHIWHVLVGKSPEPLTDESLSAISRYGVADAASGHEPQPAPHTILGFAPVQEQDEVDALNADRLALRSLELGALEDAVFLEEPLGYFCQIYFCQIVTARRLRPLRRRLARILRPPFVAIRARKPCLRSRLKLWGW